MHVIGRGKSSILVRSIIGISSSVDMKVANMRPEFSSERLLLRIGGLEILSCCDNY